MSTAPITTRKQALAEARRMGLRIPKSLKEIAPVAAGYGLKVEKARIKQISALKEEVKEDSSLFPGIDLDNVLYDAQEKIEMFQKLLRGDFKSYKATMDKPVKDIYLKGDSFIDAIEYEEWNLRKLSRLTANYGSSLQSFYFLGSAYEWLSENGEEIGLDVAEFASSKGIDVKTYRSDTLSDKEVAQINLSELWRVERLLFSKFGYVRNDLTQEAWTVEKTIPEWVRFVLGLPSSEEKQVGSEVQLPAYPEHLQLILSDRPYILIDRATRDGRNWEHNPDVSIFPVYIDKRIPDMSLSYDTRQSIGDDNQAAAELAVEQVRKLDDRTADVWRVILWKAMEYGEAPENVYRRITLDTREVAQMLGYTKHHKGGMKKEHILEIQKAIHHIENIRIYIDSSTRGTLERQSHKGGKRKPQTIQAREERIISVMARNEERDLFGATYHMVYEIALGDWAHHFSRAYAPMVRALVELPTKAKWAKRIGTELMLHYREDAKNGRQVKALKWATLLERAGLINEVDALRASSSRNTSRVRKYAEEALATLKEISVVEDWHIREADLQRLNEGEGKPGNFERWLESIVDIQAPHEVLRVLDTIKRPEKKGKK